MARPPRTPRGRTSDFGGVELQAPEEVDEVARLEQAQDERPPAVKAEGQEAEDALETCRRGTKDHSDQSSCLIFTVCKHFATLQSRQEPFLDTLWRDSSGANIRIQI